MEKDIFVHYEKCMGCRSCELACSTAISPGKTLLSAIESGSKAKIFVEQGNCYKIPLNCRQCAEAPCIDTCVTGAMHRDEAGMVSNAGRTCSGCWMCVMVCPYGVVRPDYAAKTAVKCNRDCTQTPGTPACVMACPTGALVFLGEEEAAKKQRLTCLNKIAEGEILL